MRHYLNAIAVIWKGLAYLLAFLMMALVAVVFYQVICRFLLRGSNGWTQEISTLIFVWATYLGAALAVHNGAQIAMTALLEELKYPVRQLLRLVSALICEAFYGLFCWAGLAAMRQFFYITTPALRIPMPWCYGALAFSGLVMLALGTVEIIKPVRALLRREPEPPETARPDRKGESECL